MSSLFDRQKAEKLKKVDLSRKGSVDEPIVEFIQKLNQHQDFVSLSSCSGRIIIFVGSDNVKKGCQWILVEHEEVKNKDEVWQKVVEASGKTGVMKLKFEAFILHVQCRDFDAAKRLLTISTDIGFRNSGFTIGKAGKVVLAVRSTHGLEVPLTDENGTLLVDKAYIDFVLDQANAKLRLNCEKISKLEKSCEKIIWPSSSSVSEIILQQNDD